MACNIGAKVIQPPVGDVVSDKVGEVLGKPVGQAVTNPIKSAVKDTLLCTDQRPTTKPSNPMGGAFVTVGSGVKLR